jgi:3-deoxy-D-manno-octulosonic-acid transferase
MFRKKYKENLLYKIGLKQPDLPIKKIGEYCIWIHAVSLGETKASFTLIDEIERDFPDAKIIFSTTTATGQSEAKKRLKNVFYLPLDFSWLMKKLVKQIEPDLFVLIETDFWYNLLTELKKKNVKTALVNGKISKTSSRNFKKFRWFAHKLFNLVDCYCVQSEIDKDRFLELGVDPRKIAVTGNIKFDGKVQKSNIEGLCFPEGKKLITIASTHENEEEIILAELAKLDNQSHLCYLLAPRHPERFKKIYNELVKRKIPVRTIGEEGNSKETVVLIDRMGIMDECYARSAAVIMGGSFISHVGGHNIYEAARHGIPVIYGPYMHKQESILNSLKNLPTCTQIPLEKLSQTVQKLFFSPQKISAQELLKAELEGATARSWKYLKQIL